MSKTVTTKNSRLTPRGSRLSLQGLRAFLKNTSGNVAMLWGISVVPLVGFAGIATDVSNAVTVKTRLSQALDATGLAVARSVGLSEDELQELATSYLNANYPIGEAGTISEPTITIDGNVVKVSATANVKTTLLNVIGVHDMDVYAEAEITRVTKGLEVALVLDNTGSMNSSGKMPALREAATDLVNILYGEEENNENLKLALVPFVTAVNINVPGVFTMDWMDQDAESDFHGVNFLHVERDGGGISIDPNQRVNHFDLFDSTANTDWKGCVEMRPEPFDTTDDPPSLSTPNTLWTPYFWPDEPDCKNNACTSSSAGGPVPNESEYHNRRFIDDHEYVRDSGAPRDDYEDFLVEAENIPALQGLEEYELRQMYPGVFNGALYEGKLEIAPNIDEIALDGATGTGGPNKSCARPIVPLTSNKTTVLNEISLMAPHGGSGTNIAAGLSWGWRVLSPSEPFTEGVDYDDPETTKALILLTDGQNQIWGGWNSHNKSNYSAYGYLAEERLGPGVDTHSEGITAINNKVALLCDRIKDENIRLYTITFKVSGSVKSLFRNCATDPELYYDSPSNSELQEVFQTIAQDLSNLRISK